MNIYISIYRYANAVFVCELNCLRNHIFINKTNKTLIMERDVHVNIYELQYVHMSMCFPFICFSIHNRV